MIAVDEIVEKAERLDSTRLKLLAEYVEFLLTDQRQQSNRDETLVFPPKEFGSPFAPTTLEAPGAPSVYRGPALSLEQMHEAVDWEAGRRR